MRAGRSWLHNVRREKRSPAESPRSGRCFQWIPALLRARFPSPSPYCARTFLHIESKERRNSLPLQANTISIPENGSPFKGAGNPGAGTLSFVGKSRPRHPGVCPRRRRLYLWDCQALGSSAPALLRASAIAAAKPRAKVTRLIRIMSQLTPVMSVRRRIATGEATTSPSTAQ